MMMCKEKLLRHFMQIADAPEAVAKIRELVLQLAIQGKLVHQDPNDEPATCLISQIAEEKHRLVATRIIRDKDEAAPITNDEPPFEVPYGWEWTRLSSITRRIHYGYTASAKSDIKDVRLLRITDIQNNFVDWPSVPGCEITKDDVAQYQLERGDILVARTGGTVGKTYLVQDVPVVAVFASYLIRIQGAASLCDRYLKLFLESPTYWVQLEEGARGAAQPNVNGQTLGRMVVPIPPLAEQKRIVAKVDELMALCDRLEAQLKERDTRQAALARAALARFAEAPTPANLELLFHDSFTIDPADLRKTILTLAVQGKLVPQDPNDESAIALLDVIHKERYAAIKAKQISSMNELPHVELHELSFDLRPGWSATRMSELVMEIQTGPFGSSLHKSDYLRGGIPVINPSSLIDGKIVPLDEMAIGNDTMQCLKTFQLNEGDIVMARRGEMGRCAVVTEREHGWLCGTGSLILRLPKSLYPPYLAMLIGSPVSRDYLSGASVGTTMQNLNQSILAKMPVALPPFAEQRRIIAKVYELMALVDQLEAHIADRRATTTALMNAMLAELTTEA